MDDFEEGFEAGFDEGYLTALAQLESGEARLLGWNGLPLQSVPVCEACSQEFPPSEYGVTLRDDVWETIAPRPGANYMESGLLCLDCIKKRLGRGIEPDDVTQIIQYGERPTFRVARLTFAFPVEDGLHLQNDEGQPLLGG